MQDSFHHKEPSLVSQLLPFSEARAHIHTYPDGVSRDEYIRIESLGAAAATSDPTITNKPVDIIRAAKTFEAYIRSGNVSQSATIVHVE